MEVYRVSQFYPFHLVARANAFPPRRRIGDWSLNVRGKGSFCFNPPSRLSRLGLRGWRGMNRRIRAVTRAEIRRSGHKNPRSFKSCTEIG